MPTSFLSDEQRRRYGRFHGDPNEAQLARYFHLDATDRGIIDQLRGSHNRLGFALQLTTARFLGVLPNDPADAPPVSLRYLAQQLKITDPPPLEDYRDGRSRKNHTVIIRQTYGYRDFATDGYARFRLTRWLYTLAWAGDDRPSLLIDRATSWLIANKILLPGSSILERLVGRIRHRVHRRLWRAITGTLTGTLTEEQHARIESLLTNDGEDLSTWEQMRTPPLRRRIVELTRQFQRINTIRGCGLRPDAPAKIPAALVQRLARLNRTSRPSALLALQEPRRTATVTALFLTAEATLDYRRSRLRTLRDLDAAATMLKEVARQVVFGDELPLDGWRSTLLQKIPKADIETAMARIETLVQPPDSRHYKELSRRWRSVRRCLPT